MEVTNQKGFSGIMLHIVYFSVLVVATFTKMLVICERRKMKDGLGDHGKEKVTKEGNS